MYQCQPVKVLRVEDLYELPETDVLGIGNVWELASQHGLCFKPTHSKSKGRMKDIKNMQSDLHEENLFQVSSFDKGVTFGHISFFHSYNNFAQIGGTKSS